MRKTVFIVSHLGSGCENLLSSLLENSRIILVSNYSCNYYRNLLDIINVPCNLKYKNKATYSLDCLLYNHMFSARDSYKDCKFIYLIDEPRYSLPKIYKTNKYPSINSIKSYYLYRLRRICEMAKRTENAVFLTRKDLRNPMSYKIIENYLNLKEKLEIVQKNDDYLNTDSIPQSVLDETELAYEKYLYYLKLQKLIFAK